MQFETEKNSFQQFNLSTRNPGQVGFKYPECFKLQCCLLNSKVKKKGRILTRGLFNKNSKLKRILQNLAKNCL